MSLTKIAATLGDSEALAARVEQELRNHKGKFIVQGMVFILAGALAAGLPGATALNTELVIGVILLLTGAFQMILTLRSKLHWWSLLSAGLSIAIGIVILWKPLPVLLTIVTVLAIFMTLEGLLELMLAFEFRGARNWRWMLFSGIISLVLAAVLWIGFPGFDLFYLGWVIAVNLICYGVSLLLLVWKIAA
ncbi:MAG TPA: DUF308 domain-containing protein [Candidatus Binataceae bacterium]|nr:DUF308 domain-containing protein [Candidatus Binataceae bacterium]